MVLGKIQIQKMQSWRSQIMHIMQLVIDLRWISNAGLVPKQNLYTIQNYFLLSISTYLRTFDTVNHRTMLKKSQHIGIKGRSFDLFQTYLPDLKQYVAVDGSSSTSKVVDSAILQQSNSGPLLCLLYLNDLRSPQQILNFVNFVSG